MVGPVYASPFRFMGNFEAIDGRLAKLFLREPINGETEKAYQQFFESY